MQKQNLKLFYIHEAFFQLTNSMLMLVIPLFIYELFGTVSAVFAFCFIWNLIYSATFLSIFNWGMHIKKPQYMMAIGIILYVASLSLMGQVDSGNIYLMIPAVLLFSLYISFYWLTRHWFFSVNSDYKKIGKQISIVKIIGIAISVVGPIIGGTISFLISFHAAFFVGAITGIISIIPILFFKTTPHPKKYDFKKVLSVLRKPEMKAIRPAHLFEGLHHAFINDAWILAFAIFIGSIRDLGYLIGITALLSAIVTWLVGNWFDARKRRQLLTRLTIVKTGTILLYSGIFFFPYLIYIWIVQFLHQLVNNMHVTAIDSYLFAYSNKIHPVDFHINREVNMNITRFFGYGGMAIVFYFVPDEFLWISIAIGAIMTLGWLHLKKSDHLLH